MEKHSNIAIDTNGNALSNASVSVYLAGTSTLASIFSDDGITPKSNPITSSVRGAYWFYAGDGSYDVVVAKAGYTADPLDTSRLTLLGPIADSSITNLRAIYFSTKQGLIPSQYPTVELTLGTAPNTTPIIKQSRPVGDFKFAVYTGFDGVNSYGATYIESNRYYDGTVGRRVRTGAVTMIVCESGDIASGGYGGLPGDITFVMGSVGAPDSITDETLRVRFLRGGNAAFVSPDARVFFGYNPSPTSTKCAIQGSNSGGDLDLIAGSNVGIRFWNSTLGLALASIGDSGTFKFSQNIIVGTTSAGAESSTARWIGPNGSAVNLYKNVPTTGEHGWMIANVKKMFLGISANENRLVVEHLGEGNFASVYTNGSYVTTYFGSKNTAVIESRYTDYFTNAPWAYFYDRQYTVDGTITQTFHNGRVLIGSNNGVDIILDTERMTVQGLSQIISQTTINAREGVSGGYGCGYGFLHKDSGDGTIRMAAKITADGELSWNGAANRSTGLRFFTRKADTLSETFRLTSAKTFYLGDVTAILAAPGISIGRDSAILGPQGTFVFNVLNTYNGGGTEISEIDFWGTNSTPSVSHYGAIYTYSPNGLRSHALSTFDLYTSNQNIAFWVNNVIEANLAGGTGRTRLTMYGVVLAPINSFQCPASSGATSSVDIEFKSRDTGGHYADIWSKSTNGLASQVDSQWGFYTNNKVVNWYIDGANYAEWRPTYFRLLASASFDIKDGITAPSAVVGQARIYVDAVDGDLKVIFGDGVIKTIVIDT